MLIDIKHVANLGSEHTPLVVAEVVDNYQKHLFAIIDSWEYLLLEYLGTEHRMFLWLLGHPIEIVVPDILCKTDICFLLLHIQHLGHTAIGRTKLQLPMHKSLIRLYPVVGSFALFYLLRYIHIVLLISRLRDLGNNLLAMNILL